MRLKFDAILDDIWSMCVRNSDPNAAVVKPSGLAVWEALADDVEKGRMVDAFRRYDGNL